MRAPLLWLATLAACGRLGFGSAGDGSPSSGDGGQDGVSTTDGGIPIRSNAPAPELCDGVDNDMDTKVDEGCSPCTHFLLSQTAGPSDDANLVATGDGWGIVYDDYGSSDDIVFAKLDLTGAVTTAPKTIVTGMPNQMCPSIAWDGTGFGVVYQLIDSVTQVYTLEFINISATGTGGGSPNPVSTGPYGCLTSLVRGPGEWATAFVQQTPYFRRIDNSGTAIGAQIALAGVAATPFARVMMSSSGYAAAFSNKGPAMLARFDAAGQLLGDTTGDGSPKSTFLDAARTDGDFSVVYAQASGIELLRLDDAGAELGRKVIAAGTLDWPAIAWTGSDHLIAWTDGGQIATVRTDLGGNTIPGSARSFTPGGYPRNLRAACNGGVCLLVYSIDTVPMSKVEAAYCP